jgi:hypothetical protein
LLPLVQDVRAVAATLDPATAPVEKRQASFQALAKKLHRSRLAIRQSMAKTMDAFAPGLFVGGDDPDIPRDNQDLERFFRLPKSHERRIHGHRHVGIRVVLEGPTLLPTLNAHDQYSDLFSQEDLAPYAHAPIPAPQLEAIHRRRIMRKASSTKQRPILLHELEKRYADSS